jgi:uncharacterized protein YkwD
VRGGGSMTQLRPQNVAAALVRTAELLAVARGRARGSCWLPGRVSLLAVSVLLCVATSAGAANAEARATALRPLERSVLTEMNAVRSQHGLVPLRFSAGLAAAARQHSTEMANRGYFGHTSANGEAFSRRLARFYPIGARRYWSVGENLLWSSAELNAAAALEIWLNSPSHRAIMLNPRWLDVGVGAVYARSASGVYGGRDVTIVTADFGVRR